MTLADQLRAFREQFDEGWPPSRDQVEALLTVAETAEAVVSEGTWDAHTG